MSLLIEAHSELLSAADINTTINHEPRILDVRLAEALGYERPRAIREIIERHKEALERFGEVCRTVRQTSAKGGRPTTANYLTKRQALYLCTKSETPNATEVTIRMVEVFDEVTSATVAQVVKTTAVKAHERRVTTKAETAVRLDVVAERLETALATTVRRGPAPAAATSSEVLRELYRHVMNANVRVEKGEEASFGPALESVLADRITIETGGKPSGKTLLFGTRSDRRFA